MVVEHEPAVNCRPVDEQRGRDEKELRGLREVPPVGLGALGLAKSAKRFPKKETLHFLYSRHVNTELPLDELLHHFYAVTLAP